MKRSAILILIAIMSALPGYAVAADTPAATIPAPQVSATHPVQIGFVDMARVASESASGKVILADVKGKAEAYQKQIKAKEQQLLKQKNAIEAQMPRLTPPQRQAKAKEFQKKIEDLQKFVQNADKDVRTHEAGQLAKLYKSIETAAGEHGKAKGFAAIVMKKDLLFIGEGIAVSDLTDTVIQHLDAQQAKPAQP